MKKWNILFWIGLGNLIWATLLASAGSALGDNGAFFIALSFIHYMAGVPLLIIGIVGKKRKAALSASVSEASVAAVTETAIPASVPFQSLKKGYIVSDLPEDYTVIDIETTGLSKYNDHIIEIGALKIRGGKIINTFETLIKPPVPIPTTSWLINGISDEMVTGAPSIQNVLYNFRGFIGEDLILGHNITFDVDFLNVAFANYMNVCLDNNMIDTLSMSRHLLRDVPNYKLGTIADYFSISTEGEHRALKDCCITNNCYIKLRELAKEERRKEVYRPHHKVDLRELVPTVNSFDTNHIFYDKRIVLTGNSSILSRWDLAQKIVDVGGHCDNGITMKTDYLVAFPDAGKTKMNKALEYIDRGLPIHIIDEERLYEILGINPDDYEDSDDV